MPAPPAGASWPRRARDPPRRCAAGPAAGGSARSRGSRRQHVQVDVFGRRAQHAVLVPRRLADAQLVAGRLERRDVGGLVGRVDDDEEDVDDRLGGEAGDGRRADVFEQELAAVQGRVDPRGLRGVAAGQAGRTRRPRPPGTRARRGSRSRGIAPVRRRRVSSHCTGRVWRGRGLLSVAQVEHALRLAGGALDRARLDERDARA